jgi:hypothetical protein
VLFFRGTNMTTDLHLGPDSYTSTPPIRSERMVISKAEAQLCFTLQFRSSPFFLINHQVMKTYGGVEVYFQAFLPRHKIEFTVSRLIALPPGENPQTPTGWALKAVWTIWSREKSLTPTGNRTLIPRSSTPSLYHMELYEPKLNSPKNI